MKGKGSLQTGQQIFTRSLILSLLTIKSFHAYELRKITRLNPNILYNTLNFLVDQDIILKHKYAIPFNQQYYGYVYQFKERLGKYKANCGSRYYLLNFSNKNVKKLLRYYVKYNIPKQYEKNLRYGHISDSFLEFVNNTRDDNRENEKGRDPKLDKVLAMRKSYFERYLELGKQLQKKYEKKIFKDQSKTIWEIIEKKIKEDHISSYYRNYIQRHLPSDFFFYTEEQLMTMPIYEWTQLVIKNKEKEILENQEGLDDEIWMMLNKRIGPLRWKNFQITCNEISERDVNTIKSFTKTFLEKFSVFDILIRLTNETIWLDKIDLPIFRYHELWSLFKKEKWI